MEYNLIRIEIKRKVSFGLQNQVKKSLAEIKLYTESPNANERFTIMDHEQFESFAESKEAFWEFTLKLKFILTLKLTQR